MDDVSGNEDDEKSEDKEEDGDADSDQKTHVDANDFSDIEGDG